MALHRTSSAEWEGDLASGKGVYHVGDGVCSGGYTFASRFESDEGTNPEELVAAALAACYAMFLSDLLAEAGHSPENVRAEATATLDPEAEPPVTGIALTVVGQVPGIDEEGFLELVEESKGCPISQLYAGTEITVDATLVS